MMYWNKNIKSDSHIGGKSYGLNAKNGSINVHSEKKEQKDGECQQNQVRIKKKP